VDVVRPMVTARVVLLVWAALVYAIYWLGYLGLR
jgi:hypothetical protein